MLSQVSRTVGSAVERFVDIEEVTGSIPVRSTTRNAPDLRLCGQGFLLLSASCPIRAPREWLNNPILLQQWNRKRVIAMILEYLLWVEDDRGMEKS